MSASPFASYKPPPRHVHLSFHNDEQTPALAANFNPDAFARTLQGAHVQAVTCFARCDYGWLYYDSPQFPDRVHPNLMQRDLLAQQVDACRRLGLRVLAFTPLQRDALSARRHPDWRVQRSEAPALLCLNSDYRSFLKAHVRELLAHLPLDGLIFGGCEPLSCACSRCSEGMRAAGLDPTSPLARRTYGLQIYQNCLSEITSLVQAERRDISLAFEGATPDDLPPDVLAMLSHFEFDVQRGHHTGGALPLSYRQGALPCVGRTSRFRGLQSDPYTYRDDAALAFDCAALFSQGCAVSISDRLPPSGKLDAHAYKQIGSLFAGLALKAAWGADAAPLPEIGVLDPTPFGGDVASLHGCIRLLRQGAYQFELIGAEAAFEPYTVLILPDAATADAMLAARLEAYLARGGRLFASYHAGMNPQKSAFALPALGVRLAAADEVHSTRTGGDFLLPGAALATGLPSAPQHMVAAGVAVAAQDGARILADLFAPQFQPTDPTHHAPPAQQPCGPAIVATDNTVYFAHNIFAKADSFAPGWIRTLFSNAMGLLLPEPLVRHDGPATLCTTVTEQAKHNRWLLHLQHDTRGLGGALPATLDEEIPLYELKFSLKVPRSVCRVAVRPQHYTILEFWESGDRLEFVIPVVQGHTMISVEFA